MGGRKRNKLPENGEANGSIVRYKRNSKKIDQIRNYDANGQQEKDIDFGHNHNSVGDPHAHNYYKKGKLSPNKSRGDGRTLSPNEMTELNDFLSKYGNVNGFISDNPGELTYLDMHDDEIIVITYHKDYIDIETNRHVISLMQISNVALQDLLTKNLISAIRIDYDTILAFKPTKNTITFKSKDNNNIKVNIESSIGLQGHVVCKRLKVKNKNIKTKSRKKK